MVISKLDKLSRSLLVAGASLLITVGGTFAHGALTIQTAPSVAIAEDADEAPGTDDTAFEPADPVDEVATETPEPTEAPEPTETPEAPRPPKPAPVKVKAPEATEDQGDNNDDQGDDNDDQGDTEHQAPTATHHESDSHESDSGDQHDSGGSDSGDSGDSGGD